MNTNALAEFSRGEDLGEFSVNDLALLLQGLELPLDLHPPEHQLIGRQGRQMREGIWVLRGQCCQ